jgi:hypothetical protein
MLTIFPSNITDLQKRIMSYADKDLLSENEIPCSCGVAVDGSDENEILIYYEGVDHCKNSMEEEQCKEAKFTWDSENNRCLYTQYQCELFRR